MLREAAEPSEDGFYPVEDLMPLVDGKPVTIDLMIKTWAQAEEEKSSHPLTGAMLQLFEATRQ